MNHKKGFSNLFLPIIIALMVIGGGVIYFVNYQLVASISQSNESAIVAKSSSELATLAQLKGSKISTCQEIKKSGNYTVTQNITSSSGTCINIHDTKNVTLDCKNHVIASDDAVIAVKNVSKFSMVSCQIKALEQRNAFVGSKIDQGNIQKNTILRGNMALSDTSNLAINNNTFYASLFQSFSSLNVIEKNIFTNNVTSVTAPVATLIGSSYGSKNKIIRNTIDGKSDGIYKNNLSENTGADDGIVVTYEIGDTISGNTIKNGKYPILQTLVS